MPRDEPRRASSGESRTAYPIGPRVCASVASVLLLAAHARAQGPERAQSISRVSLDSAVSISQYLGENTEERPDIIIDVTLSTRLGRGWVAYVRPWFRKASDDPYEQVWEVYQAALQHERSGRISTRIDLGYILQPIGLGLMDMRADTNPTVLPHMSYLIPMPAFDRTAPPSKPIASSYPPGGQFTASTPKWDARVALLASPPNRTFVLNSPSANPLARPVVVLGGGITPRTGLRLGFGLSTGDYASHGELISLSSGLRVPESRHLRMMAFEGEWAFGYTKVSGELTHDTIETATGTEHAEQWFIQGMHTLTPRWFAAGRWEGVNTPPLTPGAPAFLRTLRISEATVGYRLSRGLTMRGSFISRKLYFGPEYDRQAGISLVWARRWW